MNSSSETFAHCAVQTAEKQDLYHRQMQDYQTSLVRFFEINLPAIVKAGNPTPITEPINSIDCSHQVNATLSTRATIEALKKLQAKILADITTLESETFEETHPLSQVVTDDNGFSKAIVSFYASPRADPLSNETSSLPSHSSTKPPRIAMNSPSTGIPILMKTPLKVQLPPVENTTDRFSSYPAVQSPIVSSPAVGSTPYEPWVDSNYHDTGTECHSDLESVSEETEHESGCSDNEIIDKDTIQRKRTKKPSVKAEQVQKNQQKNQFFTPDLPITKGKRQRAPADRYNPDNVKRIKEEGVYLSSDKRVKEEGAPIRADQEAFKTLRYCYGKQWKRVQGLGMYRDQEVVINPRGVEYRLKNNPEKGTDFFLTAQEALAYCMVHCTPINPLPDSRDAALVFADPVQEIVLDPGNSVDNDLNSYNGFSDGNDVSSLDGCYFRSCSCSSRANCHCFNRQ